jgi:nitrous oxidase accessory protein NosD
MGLLETKKEPVTMIMFVVWNSNANKEKGHSVCRKEVGLAFNGTSKTTKGKDLIFRGHRDDE